MSAHGARLGAFACSPFLCNVRQNCHTHTLTGTGILSLFLLVAAPTATYWQKGASARGPEAVAEVLELKLYLKKKKKEQMCV